MLPPPASPITEAEVSELRSQADLQDNVMRFGEGSDTATTPECFRDALNEAAAKLGEPDMRTTSVERIRVMASWCRMLPRLGLVKMTDEANADWGWAVVRCFLAGAGFEAHAPLAVHLASMFPVCPLRSDETFEEWTEANLAAHRACGLPACLTMLPWSDLRWLPEATVEEFRDVGARWLESLAIIHVLKHVRYAGDTLRVLYGGQHAYFSAGATTNVLTAQPWLVSSMLTALGAGRTTARTRKTEARLMDHAMTRAIGILGMEDLLPADPISTAPGRLILGAFTIPVPAVTDRGGWFQHGLVLSRAWRAEGGTTRAYAGTDDTIMRYAWPAGVPDDAQALAYASLARAMPKTYEVASPFEILSLYQPNIVTSWAADPVAYACLIDSLVVCGLMRDRVPGLRREFPVVWIMPDDPTPEASTNQGKTSAVQALAGALVPGIAVTRPPDTDSAPDRRVVAGLIRGHGTIALDEWAMPRAMAHPLSARNLQTLATGGAATLGEVMENSPAPVMLRQPVIASAKCLTLPQDIVNRSIFVFLRQLTELEFGNTTNHEAVVSGEVSMRIRLAALDLIDQFKIYEVPAGTVGTRRFKHHIAVAAFLYHLRTGAQGPAAFAAIDTTMGEMERHFNVQYAKADESGLLSEVESGESVVMRASTLFSTMTSDEVVQLYDLLRHTDNGRVTATGLFKARAALAEVTMRDLHAQLTGARTPAGLRALTAALARDLDRLMPREGMHWVLPDTLGIDGWRLVRAADGARCVRVQLTNVNPMCPHGK